MQLNIVFADNALSVLRGLERAFAPIARLAMRKPFHPWCARLVQGAIRRAGASAQKQEDRSGRQFLQAPRGSKSRDHHLQTLRKLLGGSQSNSPGPRGSFGVIGFAR